MNDPKVFAEILVEKFPDEQIGHLLQAVSDRFEYGSCRLCGEEEVPVDADGNEIEGQNVEHAVEWQERHEADCLVTFIEGQRAARTSKEGSTSGS
jgi:hypothetical protein